MDSVCVLVSHRALCVLECNMYHSHVPDGGEYLRHTQYIVVFHMLICFPYFLCIIGGRINASLAPGGNVYYIYILDGSLCLRLKYMLHTCPWKVVHALDIPEESQMPVRCDLITTGDDSKSRRHSSGGSNNSVGSAQEAAARHQREIKMRDVLLQPQEILA